MSRVFLARDSALGREVVVKVPVSDAAAELSAERFAREVRLAARLHHPNIVPVLAAGEAGGIPWYTMPFVVGQSLRHRLRHGDVLPLRQSVPILTDVARALEFAHAHGVVHRDIKPENILLAGNAATVTDFGIAKAMAAAHTGARSADDAMTHPAPPTLTRMGTAMGTPAYMAPEQALGDPATDHRADLYSWGCLAYELLTGAPPFADRETHRVLAAQIGEPPVHITEKRPEVPAGLAALVMRCLAKDPAQRPRDASEVLASLDAASTPRATGGPARAAEAPSRVPSAGALASSRWRLRAFAIGATVVVVAVIWALRSRGAMPAGARRVADSVPSVAVLAMRASADSASAHLGEGMADEITVALQRLPGIRVASRATVASYAPRNLTPDSLARALGVRALVTGTIQRVGDRFRVTAELTDPASGTALWGERYERESADIFAVQEDIARAIVGALQVRLSGAAPTAPRGTEDLEAYDLYLQGRAAFQRRGRRGVTKALESLEAATRRDPGFARAWGTLALVWSQAPNWLLIPVDSVIEPSRRAAERALAIDPTLGEPDAALGYLAFYRWEWPEAERLLRQAIAKDPTSAPAHLWLGELLATIGRTRDAVAASLRAWELEPLNATALSSYADALLADGRVAEAIAAGQRVREMDPTNPLGRIQLASSLAAAGRPEDAEREVAGLVGPSAPPGIQALPAYFAALRGDRTAAERLRRSIRSGKGSIGMPPAMESLVHVAAGDTAAGLLAIERAIATRDALLIRMGISSPFFDALRPLSRFQAALAQMGLDTTRFRPRTVFLPPRQR